MKSVVVLIICVSSLQVCSDKTGTLTQNRMTVVRGSVAGITFGDKFEELKTLPVSTKETLFETISTNSTAYEGANHKGTVEFLGNKTECALLGFAKKLGNDFKVRIFRSPFFSRVSFRHLVCVSVENP